MIDFTRAFDTAWERMHIILFRPFDLGKWMAIGFSAFLAGLLQGGNGFNSSFNANGFNNDSFNSSSSSSTTPKIDWNQFNTNINHATAGLSLAIIITIAVAIFVVLFAVILLIYWLGARGQFMFLDNIVRNRGAVVWPWQNYARLGNSVFGFYLLVILISMLVIIPIVVVVIAMIVPLVQHHRWPEGGEIVGFIALGLIYLGFALTLGIVMFIFRELGIPLMFRQGLLARTAFFECLGLIRQFPGSIAIFVLLRIAIFIGVAILSLILCCLTCCFYLIPYLGTVMLLPVLVYVRCFSLECLAQFGPRYDIWTVDVPTAATGGTIPPFSPQPPLG